MEGKRLIAWDEEISFNAALADEVLLKTKTNK